MTIFSWLNLTNARAAYDLENSVNNFGKVAQYCLFQQSGRNGREELFQLCRRRCMQIVTVMMLWVCLLLLLMLLRIGQANASQHLQTLSG